MNGKKWKIADVALGIVGGLCGIIGIITGLKAADYDEQALFEDLEKKYGLEPIGTVDGEDE